MQSGVEVLWRMEFLPGNSFCGVASCVTASICVAAGENLLVASGAC